MVTSFSIPVLNAILGLVMIFAAEPIIKVLVIALGVFLIISGFYSMTIMSKLSAEKRFKIDIYIRGILSIILGILSVILPATMAKFAWNVMMIIIGVFALFSAAMEIYAAKLLNDAGVPVKRYVIEIIGTIIAAIVVFLLPSSFGFTLIKIGGIALIILSIIMAIIAWKNRDIIQNDAEVVDEE